MVPENLHIEYVRFPRVAKWIRMELYRNDSDDDDEIVLSFRIGAKLSEFHITIAPSKEPETN